MILGICGFIAAGKSTLARKIARGKIPILELDDISREVFEDIHIKQTLLRNFKTLNRQKIGKIVFEKNPEKLVLLEKITHPKMRFLLFKELADKKNAIVVAALPMSFCFEKFCDEIIMVADPRKILASRAKQRGVSQKAFCNIIKRQQKELKTLCRAFSKMRK